jgi:hypothetical protein
MTIAKTFFVGLAPLVVGVISAAADEPDFNCKEDNGLAVCNPETKNSDIDSRTKRMRNLFESQNCVVFEVSSSRATGATELSGSLAPRDGKITEIVVRYACQLSDTPSSATRKIKEEGRERYEFDCANSLFHFYASGFDVFKDGRRMHWDSQGTSRPIPWRAIPMTDNPKLISVYEIWCH